MVTENEPLQCVVHRLCYATVRRKHRAVTRALLEVKSYRLAARLA